MPKSELFLVIQPLVRLAIETTAVVTLPIRMALTMAVIEQQ